MNSYSKIDIAINDFAKQHGIDPDDVGVYAIRERSSFFSNVWNLPAGQDDDVIEMLRTEPHAAEFQVNNLVYLFWHMPGLKAGSQQ